jgi:hypothetical protein
MSTIAGFVRTTILLSIFAIASSGCAPQSPTDVTDMQIALYQKNILQGCQKGGRQRGGDPRNVDAFCDCVVETMKVRVSHVDWQRAYVAATHERHEQEQAIFAPSMDSLQTCKAKEIYH